MKVIVSGGGTGGHVYPAIAVADALCAMNPETEILFVGALGKMEMEKVPLAGYPIEGLNIRGLQRRLTAANLSFPIRLIESLVRARSIIRDFKPDVVAGFGGYASGPTVYVASGMGIPTLLQEQNSYPGITNKLLAKRSKTICVAYPGMERFFPKEKLHFTGNPVRKDLQSLDGRREEALAHFGLDPQKRTLLIFGGSLGARTLNEAMRESHGLLKERNDIQVLWQMGKLYAEQYSVSETAGLDNVRPLQFIDRMDLAYALADLVICRAGALTISELCLAKRPAILVPSPNVAEDHQTRNAESLVNKSAAVLVPDAEAVPGALLRAMDLIDDVDSMKRLSESIGELGMPNASDIIASEIVKLVRG